VQLEQIAQKIFDLFRRLREFDFNRKILFQPFGITLDLLAHIFAERFYVLVEGSWKQQGRAHLGAGSRPAAVSREWNQRRIRRDLVENRTIEIARNGAKRRPQFERVRSVALRAAAIGDAFAPHFEALKFQASTLQPHGGAACGFEFEKPFAAPKMTAIERAISGALKNGHERAALSWVKQKIAPGVAPGKTIISSSKATSSTKRQP